MKVLLIGEYNRVHKNLKLGLQELGHDAIVLGFRDGFKKVDVDIELKDPFETGFLKKLRVLLVKLFAFDILGYSLQRQIKKHKDRLTNYDIIQFINEAPFLCARKNQFAIIKQLLKQNENAFLLSCGTDYPSVSYAYEQKFRYSILTPYFGNKGPKNHFRPALNYLKADHKAISDYLYEHIEGVISNDLDYHIPLKENPKYLGMIPHAIDLSTLRYQVPEIKGRITIFHGINTLNYYKKGNDIFDEALCLISKKHLQKIDIIKVKDLPYKEYIKRLNDCHILLDQVYAYDQGYNALEAMAKGKVVFTGAEKEWLHYYNLEEDTVAINALPDAQKIAEKLEWLIENPHKILEISKNAQAFVKREHDHIKITETYLKKWTVGSDLNG